MKNNYCLMHLILCGVVCTLIGIGAGKMMNPAEVSTSTTSSVASSDQSLAQNSAKKSESSESEKSNFKEIQYYENGQIKSIVEKSVEMLKTKYEEEISELKIQITMLKSQLSHQQTIKYNQPQHMAQGLYGGGFKAGVYSHQWMLPNLFVGAGAYQSKVDSGPLGTVSFLF